MQNPCRTTIPDQAGAAAVATAAAAAAAAAAVGVLAQKVPHLLEKYDFMVAFRAAAVAYLHSQWQFQPHKVLPACKLLWHCRLLESFSSPAGRSSAHVKAVVFLYSCLSSSFLTLGAGLSDVVGLTFSSSSVTIAAGAWLVKGLGVAIGYGLASPQL